MKMFNFRTKFEVVGAIFMVAILLTVCVLGGTRIITDSNDNSMTFITNSNGGHWPATGANIVLAYADLTGGGTVTLPGNTTITINTGFIPKKNTILAFNGCKLLLDDLGVEQTYMINMYNDNVTLIDPWLDMDRANNEVNPAVGSQIAIYFNGRSHNCKIIGGLIENACQTGIGGSTHNATIIGTKIRDPGEHGVYFSVNTSDIYMQGVEVIEPGINGTTRGYGFKLNRVKSVTLENIYVEYTGYESFPGDSSIGIVIEGGSRSVKVHGRVVRASYGIYAGASSYNGRPCENIDISLTCEGCAQFANDATPGNIIGCYVHDSFMDLGWFRLDAFGEHAVIEQLTMNNTGTSPLTSTCYVGASTHNVSFTLKDSFIRGKGGYVVKIETGYDLVIENNVFINDNTTANNYCCLRLSGVSGNIRVDDNIFKGGSHWSLRYDSDNENFLCSGNRFREPYNEDTPGTAIEWVKYPTYRCIEGNINQSDIIARDTYIHNSNGIYYPTTQTGLQNARDDVSDGGKVWIPECNISFSSSLTWLDNVDLEGVGYESLLWLADGSNCDVIQINGKHNINFENFRIDGNTDGQGSHTVSLIDLEVNSNHNRNITFRDLYLFNGGKSLIDCQENSSYVTIENCKFNGRHHSLYGGAIWFRGHNCKALNNYIEDVYGLGIICEASIDDPWETQSTGHLIDGNTITGECAGGVYLENAKASNITIVNNHIFDCNSTCYEASESWWSKGIILGSHSICSNNRITNIQKTGIYAGSHNIISLNTITNITERGMDINSNNSVTDNKLYEIYGDECIYTDQEGNIISDNYIFCSLQSDMPKYGIHVNSGDVIITGNELIAEGTAEFKECAIRIVGGSKSSIITSNKITKCSYGIRLTDSDYSVVSLNIITDADYQGGIWIQSSDFVACSINTIKDSSYGIQISDSENCSFLGNVVQASSANHAIYETGTSNTNLFDGNNLKSSTSGITTIGGASVKDTNMEP